MLEPRDLYRRAGAGAIAIAEGIRLDHLGRPTPCDEWSVQELLDHLVGGTQYLRAALDGGEPTVVTGTTVDDLRDGVDRCVDAMSDPAALERTCTSPLGHEWTVAEATAGTSMDLLVHTWDLGAATDQVVALDPAVLDACIELFLPHMPEMGRAAGIVGPAVEVADGATRQQVLLGAMGRRG